MNLPIFFIQSGPVPRYLRCALEQARVSNPAARIFLLSNETPILPRQWKIEVLRLRDLETPHHEEWKALYFHCSTNPPDYEKFCFSRWFYIARAAELYRLESFVHLDSDCMLFLETGRLMEYFAPGQGIHICDTGAPHCALVKGSLQKLLAYFLETFSAANKKTLEERFKKSQKEKIPWVLSDMYVIKDFIEMRNGGGFYGYKTNPEIAINSIMSERRDFEVWPGKKALQRVHWKIENDGLLCPYFRWVSSGELLRMAALHYKGDAKKRMRRFNHLGLTNRSINCLRAAWFNTIPPINFLSFK